MATHQHQDADQSEPTVSVEPLNWPRFHSTPASKALSVTTDRSLPL